MVYNEKKIGIIGCGWFGLPLGESLIRKGFQVNGSTRSVDKFPRLRKVGINPYRIDLSDIDQQAIESFLAIDTLIINVPPSKQNESIHDQLKRLYEYIIKQTRDIHVIFVSSTAVYPNNNTDVLEEHAQHIETPRSGVIILELEEIFTKSSLTTSVIRFGGLFGPDRNPGRFLSKKGEVSGANNPVNMIHLDDCIGVLEFLITNHVSNEVFNASSPVHPSKMEFYSVASQKLGVQPPQFTEKAVGFKKVISEKIQKAGYEFKFPNPIMALKE